MTKNDRRLAVDADGFVWWVDENDNWSMVRINPDANPIPHPVTYYENMYDVVASMNTDHYNDHPPLV